MALLILAGSGWLCAACFWWSAAMRHRKNLWLRRQNDLYERLEKLQEWRHVRESQIIEFQAHQGRGLATMNRHLADWIKRHGPADDLDDANWWKRINDE
jgi:hypothetical protein